MSGNLELASLNLDEIYAQVGASSTTSYPRDGINSTAALTSGTASISANYYYPPCGDSAATGTAATSLQFTGREAHCTEFAPSGAPRAAGIEVWFDQRELRGGDVWDRRIRQRIRDCAVFIPVISGHTQQRAEGIFRVPSPNGRRRWGRRPYSRRRCRPRNSDVRLLASAAAAAL
jgi:hypothetical protein